MPLFSRRSETVDQVERLIREGKSDLLEQELQKFNPSKLRGKEKETWHLYWGTAAFRKGNRPTAFLRFKEAYAACPDSPQIRFSLAQEYEGQGKPEMMVELFRSCEFPKISSRHSLAVSRYCYLWDRLDDAVHFLHPIFDAYFSLGIADDHLLYVRGLPFFGETWGFYLCYSIITKNFRQIRDLTECAKSKLSDYDFDKFFLFLDCWETQNFTRKIQELEKTIANVDVRFPLGYQKVQLASLMSLGKPILNDVALGERDFPWLTDVLLLHRARIAGITRNTAENRLIDDFFKRQTMLFEPDHATNFGLVSYQENLKPRYHQTRQSQV
jgi:hypothetical protein